MRDMVKQQQKLHRRDNIGARPGRVLMGMGADQLERAFQVQEIRKGIELSESIVRGAWVAQSIKYLPLARVMIPGSWD